MMKLSEVTGLQRRRLLRLGVGAAVVLAVAGGGAAYWRPGVRDGELSASGREVFRAVGQAILDGSLPPDGPARDAAVTQWLARLDNTIAALAPNARGELAQLLGLLNTTPGRRWLTNLASDWSEATTPEIQVALRSMRLSTSEVRQQAYHALRELTNAAYFSVPETWALLAYPGPTEI